MNDDIRILTMLLRFSQRHMVAVPEQVYAHVGNTESVLASMSRLEQQGLIYLEGPSVRLTMAGLASAVAANAAPNAERASVHPLRRGGAFRSHAA
jgi:hypothetical protein